MMKNHINFAHLSKWFDSLASTVESPSVAIEIAMGWRTKKKLNKKTILSRHHSLFWKTMTKPKK